MSIINLDIDPAALDPNGIAENQTQLIGVSLDLDGALCDLGTALQFNIGDAYSDGIGGVKLLIDSAGAIDTVVFTIIGKDQDGVTVSPAETVTGVNTTAVSTVNYYSEVTEIQTSVAAVDSNVFVGTVTGALATRVVSLNRYADRGATATISGLTGTCQYDIEATYSDLSNGVENASWYVEVSNQSTDQANQLVANATGVRLVFDSYSDGAELQFGVVFNPYR